jgi:hypothetical protein
LKALKYSDSKPEKDQVLIVVSNPMVWSKTPPKEAGAYDETEFEKRIPLPKY